MKKKQKVQAIVTAGMATALGVLAISQKTSIGQEYVIVSVDGVEAGAVKDTKTAEDVVIKSRRQLMQQTEGHAYIEADVSLSTSQVKGRTFCTDEELQKNTVELLKQQLISNGVQAYTITTEKYSGNFATEEEAKEFLCKVKGKTEGADEFPLSVEDGADIKDGVSLVKVEKALEQEPEVSEKVEPLKTKKEILSEVAPYAGVFVASQTMKAKETSVYAGVMSGINKPTSTNEQESENYIDQIGIVAVDFADNVFIYENYVARDMLSNPAEAAEEVTKEKETNKIYVVEAGDCLSTIAEDFETTVDSIVGLNQLGGKEATVYADQELIVAVPKPDISLRVTEGSVYQEEYSAEASVIGNDSWYNTQENVLQEGAVGLREVNAVITYEQGLEVSREIRNSRVLKEAVPSIIERGTQIPPTYIKPLLGGRFTSGYKKRWGRMHKGADWATAIGTEVYASSEGTVTVAGEVRGYGYAVYISHPDGRQTRYGHNSKILVSPGQSVKQGDVIALSGNTGRSTGPHVHFEILIDGVQVNPLEYMN